MRFISTACKTIGRKEMSFYCDAATLKIFQTTTQSFWMENIGNTGETGKNDSNFKGTY